MRQQRAGKPTAHAIGRLMRTLLATATVLATLSSGSAVGITKGLVSYTLQRMWSDSSDIYVVYNVRRQTINYSLSDIDGTVTSRTDKVQLMRVSKDALAQSSVIKLPREGVSTALLY